VAIKAEFTNVPYAYAFRFFEPAGLKKPAKKSIRGARIHSAHLKVRSSTVHQQCGESQFRKL
jgi:hypothetical protein